MGNLKLKLANHLEENLLVIPSETIAFSLNVSTSVKDELQLHIISNNIDSESVIISKLIKLILDFYLCNDLNMAETFKYNIFVNYLDECTEIRIQIIDLENFYID